MVNVTDGVNSPLELYNILLTGAVCEITFLSIEHERRFNAALRVTKTRQDKVAKAIGMEIERLCIEKFPGALSMAKYFLVQKNQSFSKYGIVAALAEFPLQEATDEG